MGVVGMMALPAQALAAALCFTDNFGAAYSFELGVQQGAEVPIHGFRQKDLGCLAEVNNVMPLTGEVVVTSQDFAVFGMHVSADAPPNCVSFLATLVIDLNTGELSGSYVNTDGNTGSIDLQFSASCPSPFEAPSAPAPVATDPSRAN
jgi:hypothetical protein